MKKYKIENRSQKNYYSCVPLKVHNIGNFFCSNFEFCTIALLDMIKY